MRKETPKNKPLSVIGHTTTVNFDLQPNLHPTAQPQATTSHKAQLQAATSHKTNLQTAPTVIPAKIDTGADSSSIWASDIKITKTGILKFKLFGPESPFYTGETIERANYTVAVVRSATGEEQVRYRTHLRVRIEGRTIKALFYLSDRSRNNFPVLIGKRTLKNRFLVDVSKTDESAIRLIAQTTKTTPKTANPAQNSKTSNSFKTSKFSTLNRELKQNPYAFHQKYLKKGVKYAHCNSL